MQQEEQEQTVQLTEELVQDLIILSEDKNPSIQKQALMIILSSTQDKESRQLFLGTGFTKLILKQIWEENANTTCLSLIIQFSQDEDFLKQLLELNATVKISEALKEMVLRVFQEKRVFAQLETLFLRLSQLALSNLTQTDEGQNQFLQLSQEELHQCFYFRIILNFTLDPRTKDFFQDFYNVLLNLSSNDKCRDALTKPIIKIFQFLKLKLLQPQSLVFMQILKNLLFEYEKEEVKKQIVDEMIIDSIIEFMLRELQLKIKNQEESQQVQQQESVQKQNSQVLPGILESIKCLLILSNINFREENIEFDRSKLQDAIYELRKLKKLQSAQIDQVDVIETLYIFA